MNIREATISDISFLAQAIIEAEKSSTDVLSYTTVFGLSEDQTHRYLSDMLGEEIDGCELSISSFLVAEELGVQVGAVSGWIEGADGISSTVLKGNLLSYTLPKTCLEKAASIYPLLKKLNIDYIQGAIHKGAGYVIPEYRGQGVLKILTEEIIRHLVHQRPEIPAVYTQIYGSNFRAIHANQKSGFELVARKVCPNKEILKYLPSDSKIMMKKELIKK
ncbi:MAG: hypothetical protein KGM98_07635 [Bacteroidota bacterium]|nr:hypothetical protein [Bacteroidota bacterium]